MIVFTHLVRLMIKVVFFRNDALQAAQQECVNGIASSQKNRGSACGAYIILNNWQIPNDYPFFN